MSDIVIQVEELGKRYRIGKLEGYLTLKDSLTRFCSSTFNLFTNKEKGESKEKNNYIWALKDISFEIKKGEIIGMIGRNGSGKTTLLKILSRITEPTKGYAEINGRVGSLLEVGTGFHPELTGRENIFLNGAILGMKKVEIQRKFDEIVAFAEIEKFLDTPVKRYSSGMYVRLAFAVAAHLDPDILLVDEVLAVGDTAFQRKCIRKIDDLAGRGRTILIVSHNMRVVETLVDVCLYLREGVF
jgi:lipopolysaccharide transport system ATP-binding protein